MTFGNLMSNFVIVHAPQPNLADYGGDLARVANAGEFLKLSRPPSPMQLPPFDVFFRQMQFKHSGIEAFYMLQVYHQLFPILADYLEKLPPTLVFQCSSLDVPQAGDFTTCEMVREVLREVGFTGSLVNLGDLASYDFRGGQMVLAHNAIGHTLELSVRADQGYRSDHSLISVDVRFLRDGLYHVDATCCMPEIRRMVTFGNHAIPDSIAHTPDLFPLNRKVAVKYYDDVVRQTWNIDGGKVTLVNSRLPGNSALKRTVTLQDGNSVYTETIEVLPNNRGVYICTACDDAVRRTVYCPDTRTITEYHTAKYANTRNYTKVVTQFEENGATAFSGEVRKQTVWKRSESDRHFKKVSEYERRVADNGDVVCKFSEEQDGSNLIEHMFTVHTASGILKTLRVFGDTEVHSRRLRDGGLAVYGGDYRLVYRKTEHQNERLSEVEVVQADGTRIKNHITYDDLGQIVCVGPYRNPFTCVPHTKNTVIGLSTLG